MPSPQGEFTEPLRGADRSRAGHLWGRIGFVGLGLRCIAIGCWIPYLESEDTLGPSARHGRPREREDTRYQEARNHANLWTEVYYGNDG
ncbi:unnamed protein product [Penicillium salamii]|nr:unnamed protein product [Penicillium salamii]CAG8309046.1 unnamed protein product [Penicillium salamii]CAG8331593.1 unnamed protein product [Penicillium salamii]CAG8879439.1 unnamed protein product [Penicillium salamii]CAG8879440.1 unnamed protein product [Penicillium salamii]